MIASQPTAIKEINQLRILHALRMQPGLSRVALARQTGLGKATISTIIAEFIDRGLVREVGIGAQQALAGRRPVKLALNSEAFLAPLRLRKRRLPGNARERTGTCTPCQAVGRGHHAQPAQA
jgi:DNA-binding IclR family transcriptional regulator